MERWERCPDCGIEIKEAPAGRWTCPQCGREYGQINLIPYWAVKDLTAKWETETAQTSFRFTPAAD